MAKRTFEKGIIKVVWVGKDLKKINSKMFDDVSKTKNFVKDKKDYIIFKLLWQKDLKEFSWEILPLGKYKLYEFFLRVYKNSISKIF